jgi:hypothetical protein
MESPHRVVGGALENLANSINNIGDSATKTVEEVGETMMSALDKPFTGLTGIEGPHRAVDAAAKGAIDSGSIFFSEGIIGGAKTAGEGLMKTLDHPLEQIGKGKLGVPEVFKKK